MTRALLLVLLFISKTVSAQYQFQFKTDVPVSINNNILSQAWTGGINSAQFQKIDLNNDGTEDLVVYHRISRELTTFLSIGGEYVFSPDYVNLFPDDVTSWLILRDFNCDGLKDIFTSTPLGVKVYRNTTTGGLLEWQVESEFLQFDAGINLQINATDIPGIEDIDGDGDLDILSYRFSSSSTIDYYKNQSVENTGSCGELTFTRETRNWGEFEECNCNDISFGAPCPAGGTVGPPDPVPIVQAIEHAGGKTILPIDIDNDGDMDLVTSDEFCETLYFMENVGDSQNAVMTSFSSFPSFDPADFYIFPSAFFDDFDFDGVKDIVISSNTDQNPLNGVDFRSTTTIYKNTGSNSNITLSNAQPFLQNQMIDLGETTYPALADSDGDGDLDLFVGTRGNPTNNAFIATLVLFENTGSRFEPGFQLQDADYLNLSGSGLRNIKPQFIDLDGDGDLDLTYQATTDAGLTNIHYRINSGGRNNPFSFGAEQTMTQTVSEEDHPLFHDINRDGQIDLLIGSRFGALRLLINSGSFSFTESTDEYAGLANDFNGRNLIPLITDLDNDGRQELITTNISGGLTVHSGSLSTSFEPDSINTSVIINQLTGNSEDARFGLQTPITAGDLLGTGKPVIIVGNNRGGLYFLENLSERGINRGASAIAIQLFPNPSRERFTVRTDVTSTLEVYSVTGQLIHSNITITGNTNLELSSTGLAPGIYFIRAYNDTNRPSIKRLIIER